MRPLHASIFALQALCAGIAAWSASLDMSMDGRAELDGTLALRVGADTGGARAVLLYQGREPSARDFRAGFSCPWLSAGPLSPRGLLRETENPCGYSAGSGVFQEKTGFSLDASLPPRRSPALLLEPLPRSLGFFYRTGGQGCGTRMGGFAVIDAAGFLSLETLVELSRPSAGSMGEEWYARYAPYPGGLLVHAAGRSVWKVPPFLFTLSGGVSGCRRCPSGSFLNSQLAVGGDGLGADLLFSLAEKEYVLMDGGGSRDRLAAGGRFYARGPEGSAVLRGSLSLAREECVPSSYLPACWDFSAALERPLGADDPAAPRLRLEGRTSYDIDSDGEGDPRKKLEAALVWTGEAGESGLSAGYGDSGTELGLCLRLGDRSVSCGVDARTVFGEKSTLMTALISGRVSRGRSSLSLEAGVSKVPLEEGRRAFLRLFRASLGWRTGTSVAFR